MRFAAATIGGGGPHGESDRHSQPGTLGTAREGQPVSLQRVPEDAPDRGLEDLLAPALGVLDRHAPLGF
jgi:hypothetical protein